MFIFGTLAYSQESSASACGLASPLEKETKVREANNGPFFKGTSCAQHSGRILVRLCAAQREYSREAVRQHSGMILVRLRAAARGP